MEECRRMAGILLKPPAAISHPSFIIHSVISLHFMRLCLRSVPLVLFFSALTLALHAQPDRVSARLDNNRTVVLAGHIPPRARAAFDRGPVDASFPMRAMTLYLKPSASQQNSLEQLLAAQQNPASSDFDKWLTPEQYADRFGVSQNDVNRISDWLRSQGFQVQRIARSRTWIEFSGTARQVQNAFHTQIHQYLENGELHYANATDPSIPAAFSSVVLSLRGLNNYRLKPQSRIRKPVPENNSGRV